MSTCRDPLTSDVILFCAENPDIYYSEIGYSALLLLKYMMIRAGNCH